MVECHCVTLNAYAMQNQAEMDASMLTCVTKINGETAINPLFVEQNHFPYSLVLV